MQFFPHGDAIEFFFLQYSLMLVSVGIAISRGCQKLTPDNEIILIKCYTKSSADPNSYLILTLFLTLALLEWKPFGMAS